MRVLLLAPTAYVLGGVQTWIDYLVPGLNRLGIECKVALCTGDHHNLAAYQAQHGSLAPIEVQNRSGSRRGRVEAISAVVQKVQPDVAISANIVDTFAAVQLARSRVESLQTRAVMALHAIQADYFDDVSALGDSLDAVVVTNRLAGRLVRNAGFERSRVFYAAYGVPTPDLPAVHGRAALALGREVPVRFAYVGRFEEDQKRVSTLAAVCDALHEQGVAFELWMAGGGPEENSLVRSLAHHTAAGRVRWLGHVPANEVSARVYSQVDALINPSLWETGPIVAWEAMAAGAIVVSTRYIGSGLEGALQDGRSCCLFDIGDAEQAAQAITALCDPEFRHKLRQGGHALVHARYSVETSIRSWAERLHEIAELPLRPPAPVNTHPSGRLDSWFGAERGEALRRKLGIRYAHQDAGGEWPHSYGSATVDRSQFWQRCAALDAEAAQQNNDSLGS